MIIEQHLYRVGREEEKEENVDKILTLKTFLFLATELCGQMPEFALYVFTVVRRAREFSFRFESRLPISSPAAARGRSCEMRLKDFILAKSMRVVKITNSRH